MTLNKFGKIAKSEWEKTEHVRHNVQLDEYVIMPNHMHGIIILNDHGSRGAARRAPAAVEQFGQPTHHSIPTIVRAYKSAVTRTINVINRTIGNKLWQRNYYEHIIRNQPELQRIRKYILNNPKKWDEDKLK